MRQRPLEQEALDPNTPEERLRLLAREGLDVCIALTKNPLAPASLIRLLYQRNVSAFSFWIAQNPNTPPDILFQLFTLYPEEVSQNPAFALVFLEKPELMGQLRIQSVEKLLRSPNLPEWFVELFLSRAVLSTLTTIARSPECPPLFAERLSCHSSPTVRAALASNAKAPEALRERLSLDSHEEVRAELALSETIDARIQSFISDPSVLVRCRLVENPRLTAEILGAFSQDEAAEVRARVATHRQVLFSALRELARDPALSVRRAVTQNPKTPAELLEMLSLEESLHEAISLHPRSPESLLARLSGSPQPLVRRNVANHSSTSREALLVLVKDADKEVVIAARRNPNVRYW